MKRSRRLAAVIVPIVLALGCAPMKGYDGPARHSAELSRVLALPESHIELIAIAIDSKSRGLLDSGIDVLPGMHEAVVEFRTTESDCPAFRHTCYVKTYSGICRGGFATRAGLSYVLKLSGWTAAPFARVEQESDGANVGNLNCKVVDVSTSHGYPQNHADYDYDRSR